MEAKAGSSADVETVPVVTSPFVSPSLVRRIVLDDPDVGRVTRNVPAIIAAALHLFLFDLVEQAGSQARASHDEHEQAGHHRAGKTATASHADALQQRSRCSYREAFIEQGPIGVTLAEDDKALLVDDVERGSQADAQGISAGDVLVRVGGTSCEALTFDAALAIIAVAPRPVTLRFRTCSAEAGNGLNRVAQKRARESVMIKPEHLLAAVARNDNMDFLLDVIQDQDQDQDL